MVEVETSFQNSILRYSTLHHVYLLQVNMVNSSIKKAVQVYNMQQVL